MAKTFSRKVLFLKKKKSVAYSCQGSHTRLIDFCIWLADDSKTE